MGITRDKWHQWRKTGGHQDPLHKKRKYELGRPAANTKLGPMRIHYVRTRGGNKKYLALCLDIDNFAWGSEAQTHKTRIIDVVYNASNNQLMRTKTLVKSTPRYQSDVGPTSPMVANVGGHLPTLGQHWQANQLPEMVGNWLGSQHCISTLMPMMGKCWKCDHKLTFSHNGWCMVGKGLPSQRHIENLMQMLGQRSNSDQLLLFPKIGRQMVGNSSDSQPI